MSGSVPSQQPRFRRFVLALSHGLERAGIADLAEDPDRLATVLLEVEQMCRSGKSGYIQVNVDGGRGVVSLAPHLQRLSIRELKEKWLDGP